MEGPTYLALRKSSAVLNASRVIALLAVRSLYEELLLYPKPGLVSLVDSGSHQDMNARTFYKSLFSLRHYFREIAAAGAQEKSFSELKKLGLEAEATMLRATTGVNTHRGAIFSLGIICAGIGSCLGNKISVSSDSIRINILNLWGADLAIHREQQATELASHGCAVKQKFSAKTARDEAGDGFPSLFNIALPRLRQSLNEGREWQAAQIDALFSLIAEASDTNLYFRGGQEGSNFAKSAAREFLRRGGTASEDWFAVAERYHHEFVSRNLSPGGSADLLAATCLVHSSSLMLNSTLGVS